MPQVVKTKGHLSDTPWTDIYGPRSSPTPRPLIVCGISETPSSLRPGEYYTRLAGRGPRRLGRASPEDLGERSPPAGQGRARFPDGRPALVFPRRGLGESPVFRDGRGERSAAGPRAYIPREAGGAGGPPHHGRQAERGEWASGGPKGGLPPPAQDLRAFRPRRVARSDYPAPPFWTGRVSAIRFHAGGSGAGDRTVYSEDRLVRRVEGEFKTRHRGGVETRGGGRLFEAEVGRSLLSLDVLSFDAQTRRTHVSHGHYGHHGRPSQPGSSSV